MTLFITKNGQRMGPYLLDEVKGLKAAGQVQDNDLAWYEGLTNWIPLSQVPGFASAPTAVLPPVPLPGSTVPVSGNGSVLVLRLVTAGVIFVILFVFLFVVISVAALMVGGGIAGAQASMAQHAQGFEAGYDVGGQAGREFGAKYGGLVAGLSALASLVLSALIAGLVSFSNLLPWCRRK